MTFKGDSMMVSRFLGLGRVTLVTAAFVLGGCPGDEDDDASTSLTTAPTTTPDTDPTTTMQEETGEEETNGNETAADVTFSDVQPIFEGTCIDGCHEPGGLWVTFDMTGNLYNKLVGVPGPSQGVQCNLVEPGDTSRSYLWHKLNGTHNANCGGSGMQMPVTEDLQSVNPLSQSDLDLIEDWIAGGAEE
jgi:hypothetical protein